MANETQTAFKGNEDIYRAANEAVGRSMDAPAKNGVALTTVPASNAMVQGASDNTGTARQFGNTITSGEGRVMMNGQTMGASNPQGGSNLGNMASVTQGMSNIKSRYGGGVIGFNENSGTVTYNGKDIGVKASDYAGGINDSNIGTISNGYSQATGDAVIGGRDYVNSKGLGELVRWDDSTKTMTVGGINVPYHYITGDGHAMVSQSVLDNVIAQVRKQTGTQSGMEMAQGIYDKYEPTISDLADMVVDREQWKYNPRTDPAYQAYAKQYQANAEQAYNRAMGSGGLYGSPSSYQYYQALAGYGDNMSQLSYAVPTLAQMDYQRYSDEQARNLAALEAMQRERNNEFNMLYGANENQLDRIKGSDATNYQREYDSMYAYPMAETQIDAARLQNQLGVYQNQLAADEVARSAVDTMYYPTLAALNVELAKGNVDAVQINNAINKIDEITARAYAGNGELTAEDKAYLGLPIDSTIKIWDSNIAAEIEAQRRQYYEALKPIALDQKSSGLA